MITTFDGGTSGFHIFCSSGDIKWVLCLWHLSMWCLSLGASEIRSKVFSLCLSFNLQQDISANT